MKLLHALPRSRVYGCCGKGFTLLELLLVIGLLTVLLGSTLFMSVDTYKKYLLYTEQRIVVAILEKARSRAINDVHTSSHGVCFYDEQYLLFEGTSCAVDETVSEHIMANKIVAQKSSFASTFPSIVFSQVAATATPVTIEMTDGTSVVYITVNYEGAIAW